MTIINNELINQLSSQASEHQRLRKNHNFHKSSKDPINRMLNAFEPGTYIQPHKHENPDKREVFILLRGRLAMVYFDDSGNISDTLILDQKEGVYGVEVPPRVWHTAISLEKSTVVYEIKDGPYNEKDDKHFASWAPSENSQEATSYLEELTIKTQNTILHNSGQSA